MRRLPRCASLVLGMRSGGKEKGERFAGRERRGKAWSGNGVGGIINEWSGEFVVKGQLVALSNCVSFSPVSTGEK